MTLTQGAQAALLKWVWSSQGYYKSRKQEEQEELNSEQVNSGFETKHDVRSLRDLADGIILAQLVHELDPDFDDETEIDRNPGSSWVSKRNNLRVVYKALFRYIHHVAPHLDFLSNTARLADIEDGADTEEMAKVCPHRCCKDQEGEAACRRAQEASEMLTQFCSQLVLVVLTAAFLGPDPNLWVRRMQTSHDPAMMNEIMVLLAEKKKELVAHQEQENDSAAPEKDRDLEFEERYSKLVHEHETLKNRAADTFTRYSHMKESYDMVKEENERLSKQLEVFEKANKDESQAAEAIRQMADEMDEKRDLISQLETQLEEAETKNRHYAREMAALQQESRDATQLRDEVDSQRQKIEDLSRKANMVERLKQKLEAQQHLVTEVENLRFEKSQLQEQVEGSSKLDQRYQTLDRSLTELRTSLARAEEACFDATAQKKQLELDYVEVVKQNTLLQAKLNYDERVIKEQQDQLNSGTNSAIASPGVPPPGVSLEQELSDADGTQPSVALEVGRLKAENALLRKGMGSGETSNLRQDLDEAQLKLKKMQEQYNDVFEKHTLAQEQINALLSNASGEGLVRGIEMLLDLGEFHVMANDQHRSQVFGNMRGQLLQANLDLERERERARELEAELADRQRDLISAQADLSAVEKDGVAALEQLKQTDTLISSSLREELDMTRSRMKTASVELEQQRAQLLEALVTKDKYRQQLDDTKQSPSDRAENAILPEADAGALKNSKDKNEKLKIRLKERSEVSCDFESERDTWLYTIPEPAPTHGKTSGSSLWKIHMASLPRDIPSWSQIQPGARCMPSPGKGPGRKTKSRACGGGGGAIFSMFTGGWS